MMILKQASLAAAFGLSCLQAASSLPNPSSGISYSNKRSNEPYIEAFNKLFQTYEKNTLASLQGAPQQAQCSEQNVAIRKSWGNLTRSERLDYLSAVKCIHSKPSVTNPDECPGARNRMDDFTYAHINQTNFMHESGLLLPWHRQFVWAYEKALREECGYKGYQPYWDFSEFADDQSKSPVFDGSDTSFGGNGEAVPHSADNFTIPGLPVPVNIYRPAGTGGGCVTNGGFVDGPNNTFTINLGPVAPAHNAPNNTYGTLYNPRCLRRDFLNSVSAQNLSWPVVMHLMDMPDIHGFRPFIDGEMHPASHTFGGADVFDLFTSPSDPIFYMLHANHDRLWSVWQGQDYASRGKALDGTVTFANLPPSANATLDTVMIMGAAGGNMPIGRAMSTVGDDSSYCYMYQ